MFNCNDCKKPARKQNKITTAKRDRQYHYYVVKITKPFGKIDFIITEDKTIADDKENQLVREYRTRGWEIAKEKIVCDRCYKKEIKSV